jgi:type I restriction-modification system DNA methylase subunit
MAIKKSELYSSLWKSCDEQRGGMDASQHKNYVLVLRHNLSWRSYRVMQEIKYFDSEPAPQHAP